ncbi:MAG: response regulator [Desulfovibrio sp.]|jgi:CheY-like chemotaxis protein|nr:response regulator [Desulfovibrio sp.]
METSGRYDGFRVLLADDTPFSLEVARTLLRKLGVDLDAVTDGKECLDAYLAGHYDLVLMDVLMPEMDGLEATRRIRGSGRPDASSVAIVAMTGNTGADEVAACIAAGMDDHIAKPVTPASLQAMLDRHLKRKPVPCPTAPRGVECRDTPPSTGGTGMENNGQDRSAKAKAIIERLRMLDRMSIRPLRTIACGRGTDLDIRKLNGIEDEIQHLRKALLQLQED